MYNRLIEHLETNELYDDEQHGFRSGKSVITAGIDFVTSIVDAIDKGDHAVGIFMDLSKAFDSVCHGSLINSLKCLGINGVTLKWFSSYLKDRKQYVEMPYVDKRKKLTSAKSKLKTILHGVPQGSILGPVLFLCYIKGLPTTVSNVNCKMSLYADDTNIVVSHKSLNEMEIIANQSLMSINNYFTGKNLLLNPDKTNFISFLTQQSKTKPEAFLEIDDVQIKQVHLTKFLGLLLDTNLTWNAHILSIQKKIASGLYVLKCMSKYCNMETLKMLYYSHIHSHISFGVVLYGSTSVGNLQNILLLQKRAIRIILKLQQQDSVKHLFSSLGILTVYGMYIMETILTVRLANDKLPKLGSSHNYITRNRNQIAVPNTNLKFARKNPLVAGIQFYNDLPVSILQTNSISIFKKKLKLYLINKALYSFEEFFMKE